MDPTNPSGLIPSTGQSVYEIDLGVFEGSGQPWRRVGSDLTDWFNFGFDEASYIKFLRYRAEMEAGRNAMVSSFRVRALLATTSSY
jgi:pre-mRNA 3'-end-processing factor FIP1